MPHQEERLARQAAEARAQAAESLLQIAERCAWAETAVRQALEDRLLETEAVLPVGRTQESLASQGGTDRRCWRALAYGSAPAYMALECELQLIGSPGLGGPARQPLRAHPVPQRVVKPLRQRVRPACWKAGSLVGLR